MIFIKNLTKRYKAKNRTVCTALDNVNLTLPDKGMIFIIGKSGSGKSTLLNMIGGLDSFDSGRIISCGNDLSTFRSSDFYKYRASHVGFIFQDFHLIEELSVADNIRLSCEIANVSARDVDKVLAAVDLKGYGGRFPAELSGGEKKRVVIARALIKNPEVILCDEPAGNLDNNTSAQIMDLLHKISKDKLVITVSHDMPDAEKYGDRIIELQGGKIVSDSTKRQGYKNELTVKGGVLVLPHNKNLTPRDIAAIKNYHRASPIRDLRQNDDGYDPTGKIADSNKRTRLKSSKMSFGSIMKLFFAFLGSSKIRAVTTALISAVMLVLLIIMQSFLTFDGNRAVSGMLNSDDSTVTLLKTSYTDKLGNENTERLHFMTEEDLSIIDDIGGRNLKSYTLYNYCLPLTSTTISNDAEGETVIPITYGYNHFFAPYIYGTLVCDEDYLIKKFGHEGELKLLAGTIDGSLDDGSIIITDYTADSMMYYRSPWKANSYEDIIGICYFSGDMICKVAAVIDTGYKEKYAEEISIIEQNIDKHVIGIELLEMEDMQRLSRDISTNLSIAYTTNPDFINAAFTNSNRDYLRLDGFTFGTDKGAQDIFSQCKFKISSICNEGELRISGKMLSYLVEAGLVEYDWTSSQSSFKPFTLKIQKYEFPDQKGALIYEKEFTVSSVTVTGAKQQNYMNEKDMAELIKYDIIPSGVYLEEYNNIDRIINAMEKRGFIWPASNSEIITFLTDSISMFVDLFKLLELITLALIIIFLGSYGISNVRANHYQIGVIKALGGRGGDISKIYLLENAVISVFICIFSYIGSILLVDEANEVVLNSFETIVGTSFGQLTIIAFSTELLINAFALTLVLGLAATVVPLLILHRIKPIKIIKAKE